MEAQTNNLRAQISREHEKTVVEKSFFPRCTRTRTRTNYRGKLIYPEERANRRIYFVVSTPFSSNHVSGPTRTPLSLSLSRSVASARHNITILYSLTIGSQPSVSWSDLSSAMPSSSFFSSSFVLPSLRFRPNLLRNRGLFPRESNDRVGSSRPLSRALSNAPSFRIHKDGGFRGTLLIYEEYEAFLGLFRLNPEQSSSTNYREI